ncbi:S41 family peptidase [Sphingomonas sp.]|uniref:S41 family peptidase n=1 Tax=Sphingomonas sp. TaxID=28214 RepID=UPI00286A29BF|nr:S41 family peptidase [Sphingomonas sp.]
MARAGKRDGVAETLADLVEREYPDPLLARAIATGIRREMRSNRYSMTDPQAFAAALTADLRKPGHDEHLKVTYDPKDAAMRTSAKAAPAPANPPSPKTPSLRAKAVFGPQGYGVIKAELLEGNIGLLRIDNFVPLYDLVKERIGHAIDLLSDSWAMILDLRHNGGGTSDTPAYLLSYFFDRPPFLLNRMVWRRQPEERIETTRNIIGPSYGESRPLIAAISSETFSAAEAVAYSLQSTKRATIVGQTTRGGANPGDFFDIGQGFVAFCPQGQAVDAVTGRNWEGTGVIPDVPTSPQDILRIAHCTAVQKALAQAKDSDAISQLKGALKSGPYIEG